MAEGVPHAEPAPSLSQSSLGTFPLGLAELSLICRAGGEGEGQSENPLPVHSVSLSCTPWVLGDPFAIPAMGDFWLLSLPTCWEVLSVKEYLFRRALTFKTYGADCC